MERFLLRVIKRMSMNAVLFDINVTCTFIFGQKKLPASVKYLKKND